MEKKKMDIKKEQYKKKICLKMFSIVLLMTVAATAVAEPKRGVVLEKRSTSFLSAVFIDTIPDDGLDIPDTVMEIYEVSSHRIAMVLDRLIQEGTPIEFDNHGFYRDFGGIERGASNNITSIGGRSIKDIFSSMLSPQDLGIVFPYAAQQNSGR